MSSIKSSMIVPVYNAVQHPCACVDPVLVQSFRDMEVLGNLVSMEEREKNKHRSPAENATFAMKKIKSGK